MTKAHGTDGEDLYARMAIRLPEESVDGTRQGHILTRITEARETRDEDALSALLNAQAP
jgi:hypothetical protein